MKKLFSLLLLILFVAGFLFMPLISSAAPGNENGNGNHYGWNNGNGNHHGWGNGDGPAPGTGGPVGVSEPGILFLLGSGMLGLAGWMVARRKLRK